MLVRALIVLLIALNLGVAAWWIARPAPPAPIEETLPLGVARLRLVGEPQSTAKPAATALTKPALVKPVATGSNAPAAAAATGTIASAALKPAVVEDKPQAPPQSPPPAVATAVPTPAAVTPVPTPAQPEAKAQCFSVGPFADAASAAAARAKLQPLVQKLATRAQASTSNARGWRVYMPSASADAAQATAQRIRAAGFSDLFVMSGTEANAIALGRFRSEESARKRGAELAAAGFAVKVESLGDSASGPIWIDVSTTTSSGDDLRRAAGASRWRGRSCTGLG